MRHFSLIDQVLSQVNDALSTLFVTHENARSNPAASVDEAGLTESEKKNSIGCMRVNHTGEVCAQALYRGQALGCQKDKTRTMLEKSCLEETDHLAWTRQRLDELQGKTSYLNPFFYCNAFFIGLAASLVGDRWSLGFVEETEIQVARHLSSHLKKISPHDNKSRAIIEKMREEEMQHEKKAVDAGAVKLPTMVRKLMGLHAKVMTVTTYLV